MSHESDLANDNSFFHQWLTIESHSFATELHVLLKLIEISVALMVNGAGRCLKKQLTPVQILSLCSDMMFPSFWPSSGFIRQILHPTPWHRLTHTRTHTHARAHKPQRWKEKSSSITCITASCSDQLTTTKCPRKSIFSPRDLSAVLTSNFIFIDHSLFSSIWSVAARRAFDILPCTIKVDNMPLWQKSKSMFSWIHPAFERLILLWKVYIYVASVVCKEGR